MSNNGSHVTALKESSRSRNYKCIFFDLDHTLWDYECNAKETLKDLHEDYQLLDRGIRFEEFHRQFKQINFELWELYDRGIITNNVIRTDRFRKVLAHFQVSDEKLNAALSH